VAVAQQHRPASRQRPAQLSRSKLVDAPPNHPVGLHAKQPAGSAIRDERATIVVQQDHPFARRFERHAIERRGRTGRCRDPRLDARRRLGTPSRDEVIGRAPHRRTPVRLGPCAAGADRLDTACARRLRAALNLANITRLSNEPRGGDTGMGPCGYRHKRGPGRATATLIADRSSATDAAEAEVRLGGRRRENHRPRGQKAAVSGQKMGGGVALASRQCRFCGLGGVSSAATYAESLARSQGAGDPMFGWGESCGIRK
jgi:hypothetical protein